MSERDPSSDDATIDPPLDPWALFEQSYRAWERAAGPLMDTWLGSASTFAPAGKLLGLVTRAQKTQRRMLREWWGGLGVATRDDQARTLHALQALESRLIDLEERLEDAEDRRREVHEGGER